MEGSCLEKAISEVFEDEYKRIKQTSKNFKEVEIEMLKTERELRYRNPVLVEVYTQYMVEMFEQDMDKLKMSTRP